MEQVLGGKYVATSHTPEVGGRAWCCRPLDPCILIKSSQTGPTEVSNIYYNTQDMVWRVNYIGYIQEGQLWKLESLVF